ncbi:amidoligase family protein [Aquibaculum sediminis]|uniref:amidoligase family protein n=1 Tax=Aquibaculum sediminis TaxID=3231907 RepID=UPI0034532614
MADALQHPPLTRNAEGALRRVGVEIEFAGLDALQAANCVRELFGGRLVEHDPYSFQVEDTCYGDFECKLDSHHVHTTEEDSRSLKDLLFGLVDDRQAQDLARKAGSFFGDITRYWLPVEIVAPPVAYTEMPAFDRLADALTEAGAEGTQESVIYGFGMQFNPEVASFEAEYLRRHIQAYCLASEWLRASIEVDMTRRLLPFVDRFPNAYLRLILKEDYAPELGELIDDFLEHNPTRNRELDLLPLFRFLDEKRIADVVDMTLVKARPTFHYRLPNASLGMEGWSVVQEWNRWVAVERLAADCERLRATMQAWHENDNKLISDDWAKLSRRWMENGGS